MPPFAYQLTLERPNGIKNEAWQVIDAQQRRLALALETGDHPLCIGTAKELVEAIAKGIATRSVRSATPTEQVADGLSNPRSPRRWSIFALTAHCCGPGGCSAGSATSPSVWTRPAWPPWTHPCNAGSGSQ
jgi:hypothetical protein